MTKNFEHIFFKRGVDSEFSREVLTSLEKIQTNEPVSLMEWRLVLIAANLDLFHENIEPEIRQKFSWLPDEDRLLIYALMVRSTSRARKLINDEQDHEEKN